LKKDLKISTSKEKVARARRRQVCRKLNSRSTQRLPLSLWVPLERLRQSTAKRSARSVWLLVGSTPASSRNTHRLSISRTTSRTSAPASSSAPSKNINSSISTKKKKRGRCSVGPAPHYYFVKYFSGKESNRTISFLSIDRVSYWLIASFSSQRNLPKIDIFNIPCESKFY